MGTFAERLKVIRGDLSQTKLSQALGCSPTTIQLYEKGQSTPTGEMLA